MQEKIKDEKIKQKERLDKVSETQTSDELQDELFNQLDSFEIDKSKKN